MRTRKTRRQMFEEKVNKNGPIMRPGMTPCWQWLAAIRNTCWKNIPGYPSFWSGVKVVFGHRWAYQEYIGPIPDGMLVRHTCDNPRCVNPDHLRAGTHAENSRDCVVRGRCQSSETRTRYMKDTVRLAKLMYAGGMSQRDIAVELGVVSYTTVSDWLRERTHADVQLIPESPSRRKR